jgi:23S rRNA maturation-related 3'-5' exoribonuclease YhaM
MKIKIEINEVMAKIIIKGDNVFAIPGSLYKKQIANVIASVRKVNALSIT